MKDTIEHSCGPRVIKGYLDRAMAPDLERLGVTPSSAPFLGKIYHNEGVSLKGLSEDLLVDKAHSTRVVSKLLEAGLVENRAEGHEYSLYLTEHGKEVTLEIKVIVDRAWDELLRDLTPEERESLRTILFKISRVIKGADK